MQLVPRFRLGYILALDLADLAEDEELDYVLPDEGPNSFDGINFFQEIKKSEKIVVNPSQNTISLLTVDMSIEAGKGPTRRSFRNRSFVINSRGGITYKDASNYQDKATGIINWARQRSGEWINSTNTEPHHRIVYGNIILDQSPRLKEIAALDKIFLEREPIGRSNHPYVYYTENTEGLPCATVLPFVRKPTPPNEN